MVFGLAAIIVVFWPRLSPIFWKLFHRDEDPKPPITKDADPTPPIEVRTKTPYLKYLPDSTEGIVVIKIKQMVGSPFYKETITATPTILDALQRQSGFPSFNDIEYFAWVAIGADELFWLINGEFKPGELQSNLAALAEKHKESTNILKEGASTIYESTYPNKSKMYRCVVDDHTVVVTSKKTLVLEVLEKKAGERKSQTNGQLLDLISRSDPEYVMTLVDNSLDVDGTITSGKGGITITDRMKVDIVLTAKDVQQAGPLVEKVRSLLNTLKDTVGKEKALINLAPVIEAMEVSASGVTVTIKCDFPGPINPELAGKWFDGVTGDTWLLNSDGTYEIGGGKIKKLGSQELIDTARRFGRWTEKNGVLTLYMKDPTITYRYPWKKTATDLLLNSPFAQEIPVFRLRKVE